MSAIDSLKEAARSKVAHLLPNTTFAEFEHPNSRLLIAVTLLHRGERDLAYPLFSTIAKEGPDENENRHFAYIRSLVEMAELDAEKEHYQEAEEKLSQALRDYPESMSYMMSRPHLEVYLSYYHYRLGEKEKAKEELTALIEEQETRFQGMSAEDGRNLVGPSLCYALHQLALFYAEEKDWKEAVAIFRRLLPYASSVNEEGVEEAEALAVKGEAEAAFFRMTEAISYDAS